MNENYEKYIKDLSPELQEKARACKTKEELNAFLAENEIELPEDALKMVSGGCSASNKKLDQGDLVNEYCPECHQKLRYWDACYRDGLPKDRYYCERCNNGLYYKAVEFTPLPMSKLKKW